MPTCIIGLPKERFLRGQVKKIAVHVPSSETYVVYPRQEWLVTRDAKQLRKFEVKSLTGKIGSVEAIMFDYECPLVLEILAIVDFELEALIKCDRMKFGCEA